MGDMWRSAITESFKKFFERVITFFPNLLAMLTILIVGFLFAWIIKILLVRFLKAVQFDRVSARWGFTRILSKGDMAFSPSDLLSRFIYWVIALISLILGINALEVAAIQSLITQFFNYLPNLFAAIMILVVGYLVAIFMSQAVLIAAVNAQMESAKMLGRAIRWFISILSLTIALYHLGIAEKVITAAFTILLGGTVLALAIAFGWGGRELARDFLERIYKREKRKEEEPDRISHI